VLQQDQVFVLKRRGRDGEAQWAYRCRAGGRDSRRIQRGAGAADDRRPRAVHWLEVARIYEEESLPARPPSRRRRRAGKRGIAQNSTHSIVASRRFARFQSPRLSRHR
jgi:hypothetical protein